MEQFIMYISKVEVYTGLESMAADSWSRQLLITFHHAEIWDNELEEG